VLSSSTANSSNGEKDGDDANIYVMVNGMPGPMATAAAEACLRKGLQLSPVAMTGPNVESSTITVVDPITKRNANVRLISSTYMDEVIASLAGTRAALGSCNIYAIDYTHPLAVNSNCKFYIQQNIPFVMGTTGGNRTELYYDVQHLDHNADTAPIHPNFSCVIAPNMGKQIVAMQAALSDLATKYPGAFAGYQLQVTESHQKTKADTSGTAKAVIDSIKRLTSDTEYTYDDIQMIRNDEASIQFGVPETVVQENTGHAYHTYTLTSSDGTVQFQLQHNVIGRTIYAEGTADAVKFLATTVRQQRPTKTNVDDDITSATTAHQHRRIYDMIDVLKEGALE
jgi:4-hydroxy-tetrahydrodipicolinate reductase